MARRKTLDEMKTGQDTPSRARGPALIVAGMHRSGTSAMARVLSLAGGSLPERVIQPGPDNPLGFWEPWEMVALSDEILADVGSSWDDVFVHAADAAAWEQRDRFLPRASAFVEQNFKRRSLPVIKDPRVSVLTRLWHQALLNGGFRPVYVIMVRHPLEVAGSLAARDRFPIAKSLLVWAAYMLAVERDTRGEPRLFVAYPDLINDWRGVLNRVEAVAGVVLPDRTDGKAQETDRYLSDSHRHHQAKDEDLAVLGIQPLVETVHGWMQAATGGQAPDPAVLDEALLSLDQLKATILPIQQDRDWQASHRETSILAELADAEARLVRASGHVREIELGFTQRDAVMLASRRTLEAALATESGRADAGAAEIERLTADLRRANISMTGMQMSLSEKIGKAERLHTESESQLAALGAQLAERELRLAERDARLADLETDLGAEKRHAVTLQADWQARAEDLSARIETMKQSLGWKLARPIRVIERRLKQANSSSS